MTDFQAYNHTPDGSFKDRIERLKIIENSVGDPGLAARRWEYLVAVQEIVRARAPKMFKNRGALRSAAD